MQHRRVGDLHGHRVADPVRDPCRVVGPRGEGTDEVDAVGREQLGLAALLFALLPVINHPTGGAGLARSIAQGQWSVAGFDLAMLVLAVLHGCLAFGLRQPTTPPAPVARGRERSP